MIARSESSDPGPGAPLSPYELFNAALEALERSDLPEAVALLRGGFFGNLYVAPLLLGEECHAQDIWYPGADGEPRAAREYVTRYGPLWEERPGALIFLREVWSNPIVRAELRSFINLSRNILNARGADLQDRLRERESFLSPSRLRRTQSEILTRIERTDLDLPAPRPRLALVLLAARSPAASVEFYRKLLGIEPAMASRSAGGYAEFEFEGLHLGIHGHDRSADGDPFLLGPPPVSFGWGALFVFAVGAVDRYYDNATSHGIEIVDSELSVRGRRYFVVKDPSGYLIEVTEESPRGLDPP